MEEILLILLSAAAVVTVLDQASKRMVRRRLLPGASVRLAACLRIRHAANPRLALSSLRRWMLLAVWFFAAATVVMAAVQGTWSQYPRVQLALGSALAGTTSNFFDYMLRGSVTDMVDLRYWPVFNLADAAILTGAVVVLLTL